MRVFMEKGDPKTVYDLSMDSGYRKYPALALYVCIIGPVN